METLNRSNYQLLSVAVCLPPLIMGALSFVSYLVALSVHVSVQMNGGRANLDDHDIFLGHLVIGLLLHSMFTLWIVWRNVRTGRSKIQHGMSIGSFIMVVVTMTMIFSQTPWFARLWTQQSLMVAAGNLGILVIAFLQYGVQELYTTS